MGGVGVGGWGGGWWEQLGAALERRRRPACMAPIPPPPLPSQHAARPPSFLLAPAPPPQLFEEAGTDLAQALTAKEAIERKKAAMCPEVAKALARVSGGLYIGARVSGRGSDLPPLPGPPLPAFAAWAAARVTCTAPWPGPLQ